MLFTFNRKTKTDQVKSFPLRKISEQDQFVLVVGSIRKEEIFTGDLYWDLYVGTLAEGSRKNLEFTVIILSLKLSLQ